ncbi:hypothetical protein SEA_SKOG_45 [Gordonia phage Skog]|uniref:Uncharacterized protein n=1 Tax=Gordonia phage Skog TaxID=2704033 RepID=A0A6G6XJF4_9CAUD|nr:hypothetical protein KHQ85_gp045 [Gordonia phage Skog]QIG58197.1 hypothetical protein SEA_SKOG_45 [Gordonia phage Skog]
MIEFTMKFILADEDVDIEHIVAEINDLVGGGVEEVVGDFDVQSQRQLTAPFRDGVQLPIHPINDSGWHAGRWWRAMYFKDGEWRLWAESSSEYEVRKRAEELTEPVVIQNLYGREQSEWRNA